MVFINCCLLFVFRYVMCVAVCCLLFGGCVFVVRRLFWVVVLFVVVCLCYGLLFVVCGLVFVVG